MCCRIVLPSFFANKQQGDEGKKRGGERNNENRKSNEKDGVRINGSAWIVNEERVPAYEKKTKLEQPTEQHEENYLDETHKEDKESESGEKAGDSLLAGGRTEITGDQWSWV